MEYDTRKNKTLRILNMYIRLTKNQPLTKSELIKEFNVSAKTVQRDIDELRSILEEYHQKTLRYQRNGDTYIMAEAEDKK